MNRENNNDITNETTDEELEHQLNELRITLTGLNIQQRQIRRQSTEIQQQIRSLQTEQRRRSAEPAVVRRRVRRDRHGDEIEVGDYVNFLTRGRHPSRGGTITQISHSRFVTATDSEQRSINREPTNVEIVRKHNQDHDQRRRL